MTAACIGKAASRSALDVDPIAFDDRVGQQLAAHGVDRLAGAGGVGLGEIEIDDLALADLIDAAEAQGCQRAADRLALRVEDASLRHDVNACLHERCTAVIASSGDL